MRARAGRSRPGPPALLALLLAGCSGAVSTPLSPTPPALAPPAELTPAEPLPPLTRPVVAVPLPGVDFPLFAVQGRSPRDLWFLADNEDTGGCLVHLEPPRTTIVARWLHDGDGYKPSSERRAGDASFASVFSYGPNLAFFSGIALDRDFVYLMGSVVAWSRGPGLLRGSLSGDGEWRQDSSYRQGLMVSSGEHLWALECGFDIGECSFGIPGGPRVRLPSRDATPGWQGERLPREIGALWMRTPDDGWVVLADADDPAVLSRYNGVTWAPVAQLDPELTVTGLWADEAGKAWLVAQRAGTGDPRTVVLRFDGRALQRLPLPPSFAATLVRGSGPREAWFVGGGSKVYQWDGEKLHQGEAPFDVGDAWAAPDGEVWLVGDGKGANGVAARIAPRPAVR